MTGLDFDRDGDLRLSVAAERESAWPTDLKTRARGAGFTVRAEHLHRQRPAG